MKKTFTLLLSLILLAQLSLANSGKVLRDQKIQSKVLNEEVLYNVYLPSNYDSTITYPVLFYLHWFGADNNSTDKMVEIIDSVIAINELPKMVIISPNAKKSWYIDKYDSSYSYSTFFMDEFLHFVQKKYSISKDRTQRALMGSSMGGFGSMRFSMLYPEQFGICISFMGAIFTKEKIVNQDDAEYDLYNQDLFGKNLKGEDRLNECFMKNNPLYIAENLDPKVLQNTKWFIQACDEDYFSLSNAELHELFFNKEIQHEYRVGNGGHDGNCVLGSLKDAFNFFNNCLEEN